MEDAAASLCVSHERPVACVFTRCDVFLSSGGTDAARESFPSCLHASLAAAGVNVCGPDEGWAIGSSSLLPGTAFRRPKICIPILSKDYSSSEWCLRGLVQMMEGKRSGQQMVLPIFDGVEPSDVRYLTGSFEKARHSDEEGVQRALFEVSMLHGWKVTDGRGEELAKTVVQTVLRCLQPDFHRVFHIARYNVFLNFRGADTRRGFTYDLYTSLVGAGVSVFKDDTDLHIGEEFGSQLVSAIQRSTIYISIVPRAYASSKWCLHELVKMMECRKSMGHIVFPIFYKVEPHQVRNLRGDFGDAFRKREACFRSTDATREAKEALVSVGDLLGWQHDGDWRDGEVIRKVVQGTLSRLRDHFGLEVAEHLVGC